jgi:hypothetical protein
MIKISDLPIMKQFDDISVINICDYMDLMYPGQPFGPAWEVQIRDMKEFCSANNCNYYGVPRENFSMLEALKDTQDKGLKFVIVEDLS